MIDLVAELDGLIARWRERRSSELAALIDELSSWFELVLPDLDCKTLPERHDAWMERARAKSTVDLPRLIATASYGTGPQITTQLEQLVFLEPDPRTTRLARYMLDRTQIATRKGWSRLFDVIERHGDPRVLPLLLVPHVQRAIREAELHVRAPSIIAYLESKNAEPDASHPALVARITAELESGRALRDAVRLDNEDARLVYIDWLIDRGYSPP